MKALYTLIFVLLFSVSHSQTFSFIMTFEDAVGNKDTITIGYDAAATDTIDAAFGEVNIISTPIDTTLDVRITDEWFSHFSSIPSTFHTKKQIGNFSCAFYSSLRFDIDVHTKNWPVIARWDHTLFTDTCNFSFFTSMFPGGWFDTGSPSDLLLEFFQSPSDSVVFSSQLQFGLNPSYNYVNAPSDTVSVFWVGITTQSTWLSGVSEMEMNRPSVYPNPFTNKITIKGDQPIVEANLICVDGRKQSIVVSNRTILVENSPPGIYVLNYTLADRTMHSVKLIKTE